jgi:hypothetical protein
MSNTIAAYETRRENLRRLIQEKFEGNRANLSRLTGINANQINLLLTDNDEHRRNMGESLARRIEREAGLPPNILDQPHDATAKQTFTVPALPVPHELAHIFRAEDTVASVCYYLGSAHQLGSVTALENLAIYRVTTKDLEPDVAQEDQVIVDTGVRAVTVDGVYILISGGVTFMRRVTRQLTSGWTIHGGRQPDIHVENLKGLKACGRVLVTVQRKPVV